MSISQDVLHSGSPEFDALLQIPENLIKRLSTFRDRHLIHVLQAYPAVSDEFFEEKRQAFLKDYNRLIHVMNSPAHSDKERQRLENAVRNADIQKAWLERENTDRMQRVKASEEEIAKYEAELKDASFSEEAAQKIQKVRDATGPLEQKLKDDTAKLKELSDTIDNLHVEQALVDKDKAEAPVLWPPHAKS